MSTPANDRYVEREARPRAGTFIVKPEGTWFVAHVMEGTRVAADGRGPTETAALRAAFSDYVQQVADA